MLLPMALSSYPRINFSTQPIFFLAWLTAKPVTQVASRPTRAAWLLTAACSKFSIYPTIIPYAGRIDQARQIGFLYPSILSSLSLHQTSCVDQDSPGYISGSPSALSCLKDLHRSAHSQFSYLIHLTWSSASLLHLTPTIFLLLFPTSNHGA